MIKKIIKLNIIFLLLLSFCSCKNKSDNNSNNNKRDTIICPECKMENPKSSLYCGYCGISIDGKKICLKCEIEYSIDKKYCLKCGESLTKKCTHDWIDATCTTPKTCKKCLITQDSELGHDYGNWKQIESGIGEIRKCNRCNFEETRNFDLECISKVTIYNYKKIYNNNKEYFVFLYDSEKEITDYVLNTLIQYYNYTTKKS